VAIEPDTRYETEVRPTQCRPTVDLDRDCSVVEFQSGKSAASNPM